MTKEEYDKYMKLYPTNTVLVSVENDILMINAPGDIIFAPEAFTISPLTDPMPVDFVSWMKQEYMMQKVKVVKDESGHNYVLPEELYKTFFLDEEDEEFVDSGGFDQKYGKYMTGGSINNVQLYAEL